MKRRKAVTALAITLTSASVASCGAGAASPEQRAKGADNQGQPTSKPLSQKGQLEIKERRAGDVVILDLSGEFKAGESSVALRKTIGALLMRKERKILLNLAGVTSIDSTGLKGLASNLQLVSRVDGQLKLLNPTRQIEDLLASEKLSPAVEVYHDEPKAIESFGPPAGAKTETGAAAKKPCESKEEAGKLVRQIVMDELGVDENEVTPNALFIDDLGADSLDIVELIMRFEEEFAIEIPDEDAEKLRRVGDVNDYVWRRVCRR